MNDPNADQAKILVALQDLDQLIKEVGDDKTSGELKEMGFQLDGVEELHNQRAALADRLKPQIRSRYERLHKTYDRIVVPVSDDLCLGCFAKIPTSFKSLSEKQAILTCENCGRMLYFT